MDRGAAIRTVEACKVTHQLWIDYWDRHPSGCQCGEDHEAQSILVGSRDHHASINAEYDNVLAVLRSP